MSLGRIVAWPLQVGGMALAIAWTAWQIAAGKPVVDAVSISASGLAAWSVGVMAVVITFSVLTAVFGGFFSRFPRFLSLDWLVPAAVMFGFVLGLLAWR